MIDGVLGDTIDPKVMTAGRAMGDQECTSCNTMIAAMANEFTRPTMVKLQQALRLLFRWGGGVG